MATITNPHAEVCSDAMCSQLCLGGLFSVIGALSSTLGGVLVKTGTQGGLIFGGMSLGAGVGFGLAGIGFIVSSVVDARAIVRARAAFVVQVVIANIFPDEASTDAGSATPVGVQLNVV